MIKHETNRFKVGDLVRPHVGLYHLGVGTVRHILQDRGYFVIWGDRTQGSGWCDHTLIGHDERPAQ